VQRVSTCPSNVYWVRARPFRTEVPQGNANAGAAESYRGVPQLDSLSVRCLSSYLFFAHILVTSTRAASQMRGRLLFVRRLSSSP
jgi:hypothetical protein